MDDLIDALKGLFTMASISGGDLAETANFTLQHVNWAGKLNRLEPMGHPIIDRYLEAASAKSGDPGSNSRQVAESLLEVSDQLTWNRYPLYPESDMAAFYRNYTSTRVIGDGSLLPCSDVIAGFTLQGVDTYYPPHAHQAEESYWIIGGDGDWKVDTKPWFAVRPGDSVYHESRARHAMQTNEQPLLTVWLWTSHLNSEVEFVRG